MRDEREGKYLKAGRPRTYKDNATRQASYRARKAFAEANREISRLHANAKLAQDAAMVYRDALQAAALVLWRQANPHTLAGIANEKRAQQAFERMDLSQLIAYVEHANRELRQLPARIKQQEHIAARATEQMQGLGI